MIYSIWSPGSRVYQYYSVGEAIEDDTPVPSIRGGSKLGHAPGETTWSLPKGAVPAGSGARARGIVIHPTPAGDLDFGTGPTKWFLYGVFAFIIWNLLPSVTINLPRKKK